MTTEEFKTIAPNIPSTPGVYRFLSSSDEILYVGKAKNLKRRLASYFGQRKHRRKKTKIMVKSAERVEYTLVETEQDALLLEATLIRKHQPRYNVALKTGRPYPYICIKNERFPRVFVTRTASKDGSKYFGPYVSKKQVYTLTELIRKLFQLRTCNYNLSEENISNGKFKVCLEYHIKNCKGPCAGLETEEVYNEKIEQVKNVLGGNFGPVREHLQAEMQRHAENLEFERAHQAKEKMKALENYQSKSTVVNPRIKDVDVFSMEVDEEDDFVYVNYLKIARGAIINVFTLEMRQNLNDDAEDLMRYAILELRERFQSIAPEIILPFHLSLPGEQDEFDITVPKIGDKKKLLDLSEKNVRYFSKQQKKQRITRKNKQTSSERLLEQMKKDLQIDDLPMHIECFDNSNLQGSHPVASMVVFKNAKPAKREYRHYHIKTVEGPDDFASMEEVVFRRYKRLLDEQKPLPQLIVIDGGKGQLSSAVKSLKKLDLQDRIAIIGIAKRLEEIYYPDDPVPLHLSKRSETLKVIQHIRNEAHRFAISFHRDLRSKAFTSTRLTDIRGIGKKTARKLLHHFGSVKKIKYADPRELERVAGPSIAGKLNDFFKAEEEQEEE